MQIQVQIQKRKQYSLLTHRVPSRCEANMPKLSRDFITKEICQKVKGDFPPNGVKVAL